ncbi:MAG: aminotransferase [Alphaproteobacteria bacterium]|nr:aminotransferase [Alphaproteobacteria bacterium]
MRYSTNPAWEAVASPAIAETRAWVAGRRFPLEKPLIDVAQAVPDYPPPKPLTDHLARLVADGGSHRYTEIEGLPPLRRALADHMSGFYGGTIGPGNVAITAGCNQAYCLAMQILAAPGDEVLLPQPAYFNHQMWLDGLGVRAVHLPFRPERQGVPDPEEARRLIGPKTRAIVLVTPNNPTGAVYPAAVIRRFYELARARDIALVLDETYKDFLPDDVAPHALFADPAWAETVVHLYSFSKVYCLTGWRVGSVIAHPDMVARIAKAMDCVAICAPRLGQEAALFGLAHLESFVAGNTRMMRERARAVAEAFRANDLGYELVSVGAYFAYVRHPFAGIAGRDVAKRLADEQNLLCVPGAMFGPDQQCYLRLAFANVATELVPEMVGRLKASVR